VLDHAAEEASSDLFFAYWTLKEGYIKARGLGLSIPLDRFSCVLDEGQPARLAFHESMDDEQAWQCARIGIEKPYALSVVIRRSGPRDRAIRVFHIDGCSLLLASPVSDPERRAA
jgi:4'-phosphopantetheinyl transferase